MHFSVNLSAGDLVFTKRFGKINLITDELVPQEVDMGRLELKNSAVIFAGRQSTKDARKVRTFGLTGAGCEPKPL